MKKTKLVILLAVSFIILALIITSLIAAMNMISIKFLKEEQYQLRFVDCNTIELKPILEKEFDIKFPKEIENVKAAKSPNVDSGIFYNLKFNSAPDIVEKFLESFLQKQHRKLIFEPYKNVEDERGLGPPPDWFTEPIQRGKRGGI